MRIFYPHIFREYNKLSIIRAFDAIGVEIDSREYFTPEDTTQHNMLKETLTRDIKAAPFDGVFTVDYWPDVAEACRQCGIIYWAWSYDSPVDCDDLSGVDYDTTRLFLFDRSEVERMRRDGHCHVYHLPLATDSEYWDRISAVPVSHSKFACDISLMGGFYQSFYPSILENTDDYLRGKLNGIFAAARIIYDTCILYDAVDDELADKVNKSLKKKSNKIPEVGRKALIYAMSSYMTQLDRIYLLSVVSVLGDTLSVSWGVHSEIKNLLKKVRFQNEADYYSEMPELFRSSKINLNATFRGIGSGIPLRVLDVMGCGGFVLSSSGQELAETFTHGELAVYTSLEEAAELAAYYLSHDTERQAAARSAHDVVSKEFRYEDRLRSILKVR